MNCKEFSNLLDARMDGTLPRGDADRMRAHAAECGACAALLALRQDCRRLDEEIEVPDAFSSSWRRMIREEADMEEKKDQGKKPFPWQRWLAVAAALLFIVGGTIITRDGLPPRFTSAARKSETSSAGGADRGSLALGKSTAAGGAVTNFVYDDYAVPMEAYEDAAFDYEAAAEPEAAFGAPAEAKIIRTASFTVKTTDYDSDLAALQSLAESAGGRVEYLSSYGDASSGQARSASLTLRIPARRLDEFLDGAERFGTVTAMTREMQDVSDAYYDTQTRLDTQRAKLKRLQELMKQAEDVSDLIDIEDAIADAQYAIDRFTGTLKSYDSQVDYSTVSVSVREIRAAESETVTLSQRVGFALSDSLESGLEFLEDMAVFLVAALPWLIAVAVVIAGICLIVKAGKKQKKEK